jgi:hypothetical protein
VLGVIGGKYLHQGQTLSFTASASDAEAPPQTLTFSLDAGAPAAASMSSGGVFSWPTTGVAAPSTNLLTVRVSDNGTPPLDDSEQIQVVILAPVHFGQLSRTGNQLTMGWEAAPGQSYRVEYRDDLSTGNWQPLPGSENIAAGNNSSLSVTVDVSAVPHRFYRLHPLQ